MGSGVQSCYKENPLKKYVFMQKRRKRLFRRITTIWVGEGVESKGGGLWGGGGGWGNGMFLWASKVNFRERQKRFKLAP